MTASLTTFKVVVLERVLLAPSLLLCLNYSSFTLFPQGKFKALVNRKFKALVKIQIKSNSNQITANMQTCLLRPYTPKRPARSGPAP